MTIRACIDFLWVLLVCSIVGCGRPTANGSSEISRIAADRGDIRNLLSSGDSVEASDSSKTEALLENDTLSLTSNKFQVSECRKCNIQVLLNLEKRMTQLNAQDIYDLFCTMDNVCSDNVEFIEIGNDVLYKVLSKYPGPVMRILSSQASFDREFIYEQVESPILDYQFDRIIYSMDMIKGSEATKQRIMAAVQKAKQEL